MSIDWMVRPIRADETELFASLLQEAAEWLAELGQSMWSPEQLSAERLLKQNAMSEMFVGCIDGVPVATMIVQETERHDSLFLHKLCVRRSVAKTGCSTVMIEWAKREVRNRGKTYLRLDCAADRPKLRSFYESCGFMKVRERLVLQQYPTAFYE